MSKKSRRRNKKILGALGALGALALMGRNKGTATGVSGSNKAKFTSDAAYSLPKKKPAPVIEDTKVDTSFISPRMEGKGEMSGSVGQKIRAGLSEPTSVNVDMAEGSPMIDNPYSSRKIKGRLINRTFKSGGRAELKSGGKVKGCGKALRGFGRAMKKGKR